MKSFLMKVCLVALFLGGIGIGVRSTFAASIQPWGNQSNFNSYEQIEAYAQLQARLLVIRTTTYPLLNKQPIN